MMISAAALVEIHSLTHEAELLARGTQSERKRADVLIARAAGIRSAGISSDEARKAVANEVARQAGLPEVDFGKEAAEKRRAEHIFREFLRGRGPKELRQMTAGEQTISWTEGPEGGFLVPQSFADQVIFGLNLTTPLLDKDNVTLVPTSTGRPRPQPGIDLTQISGGIVSENTHGQPPNDDEQNDGRVLVSVLAGRGVF